MIRHRPGRDGSPPAPHRAVASQCQAVVERGGDANDIAQPSNTNRIAVVGCCPVAGLAEPIVRPRPRRFRPGAGRVGVQGRWRHCDSTAEGATGVGEDKDGHVAARPWGTTLERPVITRSPVAAGCCRRAQH